MFSLREFLTHYPYVRGEDPVGDFLHFLTTSFVGKALPDIVSEFGEDLNIDIFASPSHKFFQEEYPDAVTTGVYID